MGLVKKRSTVGEIMILLTFKDNQSNNVRPFNVEVSVDLAKRRLQRGGREQIRRAVPPDIVDRIEDRRYSRDGGC